MSNNSTYKFGNYNLAGGAGRVDIGEGQFIEVTNWESIPTTTYNATATETRLNIEDYQEIVERLREQMNRELERQMYSTDTSWRVYATLPIAEKITESKHSLILEIEKAKRKPRLLMLPGRVDQ